MAATILTTEDFHEFKMELFEELKKLLIPPSNKDSKKSIEEANARWLKSHQVQRMLGISPGTLQNLRINGTLPYTKVGGVIFYSLDDINTILQRNKRNSFANDTR